MFAGAEIAILSMRRTRVEELAASGSRRALAVAALRANPERFLATVQVGITLVSVTAAAFGGSSIAAHLEPLLAPVVGDYAGEIAFAVVVVVVSTLSIVLGELVPKSLALRASEPYALAIAPPLRLLSAAARPVVWALTAASNVLLRLFGDSTSFSEGRLSREELLQLLEEAASAGTLDADAGEIAARALAFRDLDIGTIMVPRRQVVAVQADASRSALAELALRTGHARVLVYEGDLDGVIGYVNLREVLARADREPEVTLRDALREVFFAPETMAAPDLLRELQRRHEQLAVVLDELGTVRGLVTVEDLVEELVGEILSEGDRLPPGVVMEPDGAALLDGAIPIHEAQRALGVPLPDSDTHATVAGLAIELAGRIPEVGDVLEAEGVRLEIVDATRRRVRKVRIRAAAPPPRPA